MVSNSYHSLTLRGQEQIESISQPDDVKLTSICYVQSDTVPDNDELSWQLLPIGFIGISVFIIGCYYICRFDNYRHPLIDVV